MTVLLRLCEGLIDDKIYLEFVPQTAVQIPTFRNRVAMRKPFTALISLHQPYSASKIRSNPPHGHTIKEPQSNEVGDFRANLSPKEKTLLNRNF